MATDLKNLKEWKEGFPKRENVQPATHQQDVNGAFLSGESAVLVSGPPVLDSSNIINLIPIGLVQQAQVSQNKQVNQIYEIGGRIPFFIPGRVSVNASLSRVLFDGPSLFYALYSRPVAGNANGTSIVVPTVGSFSTGTSATADLPTSPYLEGEAATASIDLATSQANADPGLFWSNLGSEIFNKPLGLGFILYDMEGEPYGGVYLEKCYVRTHNFGISANQTVLAENIQLSSTRAKPLSADTLISGTTTQD